MVSRFRVIYGDFGACWFYQFQCEKNSEAYLLVLAVVSSIFLNTCVGVWVPNVNVLHTQNELFYCGQEWKHRQSVRLRQPRLSYKSIGVFSTKCCRYYSQQTGLSWHSSYLSSDLFCWVCPFGVLYILEFYSKNIFQFLSVDKAVWFSSTQLCTCIGASMMLG